MFVSLDDMLDSQVSKTTTPINLRICRSMNNPETRSFANQVQDPSQLGVLAKYFSINSNSISARAHQQFPKARNHHFIISFINSSIPT